MQYKEYSERVCKKLQDLCKLYAGMMYETVGKLEPLCCLETKEHFRTVPTDGWEESPIASGRGWGGEWSNLWLRGSYTLPEEFAGRQLWLMPHTGAVETMLFLDGKPAGIFNSSKPDYLGILHSAQPLTAADDPAGKTYAIALECYAGHFCNGCGSYQNYGHEYPSEGECRRSFGSVELCCLRENVRDFVFDLAAVLQMAEFGDESFLAARAQRALDEVSRVIVQRPDLCSGEEFAAGIAAAEKALAPVLEKTGCDGSRGYIGIVGHSHMDTAWLWPVSETIRKCARTYANVLSLMDRYPEYTFTQSSLLHADWMREYYPSIFEGIKRREAEGRYEVTGGMWVECDCNITSGEAMARQMLYGQRYAMEQFGHYTDTFWLPDTFGYNAAIPQLMREAEIPYFCTTKLGWNDLNDFPLSNFRWKGLDGSEVLVHLHSIDVIPDVKSVSEHADGIKNKQNAEMELLPYGHGDGGGGPTPALLEYSRRAIDLPGLPKTEHTTVSAFMKKLEAESVDLPVYDGELYLELHRGTLTQMHEIKRSNRKLEIALHDLDYRNAREGRGNEKTDPLYKTLLKNQFHDILPGTTMTGVTQLAVEENNAAIAEAEALTAAGGEGELTLCNTTSFERSDVVTLPFPGGYPKELLSQRYFDLEGKERLAVAGLTLPAFGGAALDCAEKLPIAAESPFALVGNELTTPYYKAIFDEDGAFASLVFLPTGRELRRAGGEPLNCVWSGEDLPGYYDNWDIDPETIEKLSRQKGLISSQLISEGPVLLRLRQVRRVCKKSTLTQDIVFYADSPRIDFESRIDWKDKHQLLKAGFALDIRSATVKNEIQFGHIDRPTTANNSLEAAKFEICQHKWSDVSESRFGVALLNDSKYGLSAADCDLRLTLMRAGTHPDTTGDEGVHYTTYSLLPHEGGFSVPTVVAPAYALNYPPLALKGADALAKPFLGLSESNIVCEAIKPAYDRKGAVVLRLYEAERCRTRCTLTLPEGYAKCCRTNILEDVKEELPVVDGKVTLDFAPFRIVTLLLEK